MQLFTSAASVFREQPPPQDGKAGPETAFGQMMLRVASGLRPPLGAPVPCLLPGLAPCAAAGLL